MGLLNTLFGTKKKMYNNATDGIDNVKIGLCYYLLPACEANYGKNYAAKLVPAVVNMVFSEAPSNETGWRFIQHEENLNLVKLIIEKWIKPDEELRQIITDAVRVKCTLSHAMNPNLPEPEFKRLCREPIDNLKKFGILVHGGDTPDLSEFLHNAATFIQVCKAGIDDHKSQ